MYTPEQIRAAGIAGEISSIDVEHLINILKRKNKVSEEDVLLNHILNALGFGFVNKEKFISEAKKQFLITRK